MHKKTSIFVGVAFAVGAVATAIMVLAPAHDAKDKRPHPVEDDFGRLLEALVVDPPAGPWGLIQQPALAERRSVEQEAAAKLRRLGTNAFPRLMEEVRAVGRIEATNRRAAWDRTRRLARAFEILGADARPLLPLLIEELHAGRSVGPSMVGIVSIGGRDAGLALFPGLTNSDPDVRNWTMSALSYFATNAEVACAATPLLVRVLEDESAFSRALASTVLGSFRQKPDVVLPRLLQLAKGDSDVAVRVAAIKAIGRFGTNASWVKNELEVISAADEDARVRRMAVVAAHAACGQISPEEVQ